MCGIAAIIDFASSWDGRHVNGHDHQAELLTMLEKFRYRGDPELFGEVLVDDGFALGTNRLAIVDRHHAKQPITDKAGQVVVVFNGEIYNHSELREELKQQGWEFQTESDTEVLVNGYLHWGNDLANKLDGIYAFIVADKVNNSFLAVRDHVGIKPLYYAVKHEVHYFASEQKSLIHLGVSIATVAPGTFIRDGNTYTYFDLEGQPSAVVQNLPNVDESIRECRRLLENAVRKQVQTDLPMAVMFSAGIDSSIILNMACKYHPNVTAITIGFDGAADMPIAERYCKERGIRHLTYRLDRDELVGMIPHVVYVAEFFEGIDIIDACVAYFGYRHARRNGFKVALCGEGSDEVLAGYDLFRSHSDPQSLMRYRVHNLHRTDLQRVDRASMMNSVEARVPFLDKEFLSFAYNLPMNMKLRSGVEKWVLREAFRDVLPDYLIDRPKVRMPEGSGVKNILMEYAATQSPRIDEGLRGQLKLDTPQSMYFYSLFSEQGFPIPTGRHRLPGLDYSENGYFKFAS
ncbi:asparagine synthase (glutamine-hydrolyzing) [Phyllobacterium phragmitis]|uniref:asparagine synthase (glutamine-hydrolyzing) n=1 Tax=Phyllobacterium phragmitis TaxID=2670329 RepID=A0A2S9ISK6_9HYPH|nr:asparagine synthase (glutamine-hydrolyzing) [Phyllobacterium phragmitis]PRD43513.1 asparagine synthase (glutamine-hydrolyzing) [Phyllobacterium phragmitis]